MDTEYRNSGRSLASRTKIVAQIHQLLQTHHTEIWAYEAAALGFNHLNLNDDAVSVIRNYLQRFPEGYFVLHISLNFFALRKHHRVKTFKWDNCFGNGG